MTTLAERIEALFLTQGEALVDTGAGENVSALSHALQCAQLAEWAGVDAALVAAALLHSVGQFAQADSPDERSPEERATQLLEEGFGPDVIEPIRLQSQAGRYLLATDPAYQASLTPHAARALVQQGRPMTPDEAKAFEQLPYAVDAVQLRRWSDLAWVPDKRTPPLDYYMGVLEDLMERPSFDSKTGIGPLSVV